MNILELKTSKSNEGSTLTLNHPRTCEPLEGQTITVLGPDSDKAIAIRRRKEQATMDRAIRGRNAMKVSAEDNHETSIRDLARLTVGWTLTGPDGQLANNEDAYFEMYSNPEFGWIVDQVREYHADRGNFM